jgi:hypothetical protein
MKLEKRQLVERLAQRDDALHATPHVTASALSHTAA